MKITQKAFTLVELIVVITILAILATIGYVYLNNYTIDARDSARVSDMKNIEDTLIAYSIERWEFPEPSDSTNITYSWWIVWTQWVFWDSAFKKVGTINKAPTDPLWWNYYTYSVSSWKNMYNLSYVIEWNYTAYNPIINKAYAWWTKEYVSKVSWNYNWQIVATSTWWITYVFAAPSIIASDLSNTNITSLTNKFVFDGEINIAPVYSWTLSPAWSFEFEPILVYSWASLPRTPTQLKSLISNLKNSISWTVLYSHKDYKNIVELDLNDTEALFTYWQKYINEDLWGRFKSEYPKNCKEILNWTENNNSWLYTISTNPTTKTEVYCDMETDWWGWTRVRKWDRVNWTTEWNDIRKTRWFQWSEVMVTYTRYWTVQKSWVNYDTTWKKYWYQYKKFQTKQNQEWWFCWEHTTIADLVSHLTWWTWWDCSRSWDQSTEYNDIQVDDLWENIWLSNDKVLAWFDPDPCITNWHKTNPRNVAWFADWRIEHRIDSSTSLVFLWWQTFRCNWNANSSHWFDTMEVWVR